MLHPTAPTITGHRSPSSGMYLANLSRLTKPPTSPSSTKHQFSNHVYDMRTKVDLATYLHLCAWSPVPDTWIKAIDTDFFSTWPGLTSQLVRKHLPNSIHSAQGHLKMIRQHIRSTKPQPTDTPSPTVMTNALPSPGPHIRTNLVTIKCIDLSGKISTDQTGRFPVTSSKGNKYIMVALVQDPNSILAEPLKSRSAGELLRGYSAIFDRLEESGLKPTFQITDNECPKSFRAFLKQKQIEHQLAPPTTTAQTRLKKR